MTKLLGRCMAKSLVMSCIPQGRYPIFFGVILVPDCVIDAVSYLT